MPTIPTASVSAAPSPSPAPATTPSPTSQEKQLLDSYSLLRDKIEALTNSLNLLVQASTTKEITESYNQLRSKIELLTTSINTSTQSQSTAQKEILDSYGLLRNKLDTLTSKLDTFTTSILQSSFQKETADSISLLGTKMDSLITKMEGLVGSIASLGQSTTAKETQILTSYDLLRDKIDGLTNSLKSLVQTQTQELQSQTLIAQNQNKMLENQGSMMAALTTKPQTEIDTKLLNFPNAPVTSTAIYKRFKDIDRMKFILVGYLNTENELVFNKPEVMTNEDPRFNYSRNFFIQQENKYVRYVPTNRNLIVEVAKTVDHKYEHCIYGYKNESGTLIYYDHYSRE